MVKYNSLIKKSFSLYKKNPITIVPFMIMGLLSFIIYFAQARGFLSGKFSGIVFQSASLFLFIIMECGALGVVVKTASNRKSDIRDFKKAIENKWIDYLGGTLLVLAIISLGLFPFIVSQSFNITYLPILSSIGILYIGISIFLFIFFKQAILIDDKTPISSLEKSVGVIKNNLLEVVIYLLAMIFLGLIISLPLIITSILSVIYTKFQIFMPLGILITLILSPIVSLYSVLFYMEVH